MAAGLHQRCQIQNLKHLKCFALQHTHTYHKGEGLGGDCFVVLMNAVPYTHFYVRLLHPIACGIIQPTHNSEKGEQRGEEMSFMTTATKINVFWTNKNQVK